MTQREITDCLIDIRREYSSIRREDIDRRAKNLAKHIGKNHPHVKAQIKIETEVLNKNIAAINVAIDASMQPERQTA